MSSLYILSYVLLVEGKVSFGMQFPCPCYREQCLFWQGLLVYNSFIMVHWSAKLLSVLNPQERSSNGF